MYNYNDSNFSLKLYNQNTFKRATHYFSSQYVTYRDALRLSSRDTHGLKTGLTVSKEAV